MIDKKGKLLDKLAKLEAQFQDVEKAMENPDNLKHADKIKTLAKEHRGLAPLIEKAHHFRNILKKINEDQELLASTSDMELKDLAREEIDTNKDRLTELEEELRILMVPSDPRDSSNAIMEIRAGTGGDEAALFAGDLYRMYSKFIEGEGWKKEILSSSPTELGGFKEVIFAVSGDHAYGMLKYESGVHRVQRVPSTETSGRIHTSAASLVVLPEVEEVDVTIDPNDLRIDVYRSSGPGGQSVNTTDSAVRITHEPTGLVVTCQDEKSQHKNKAKALKVLRARLYDIKRQEEEAKVTASRRIMIGSGDRSAKIRTYNFPQGRVTDHRINLTLYRLQEILEGDLSGLIHQLQIAERDEILKAEG